MRSGAPPFRNGRFANRPYEGKTITWLSRFHRAAIRNGTHIWRPLRKQNRALPARAFARICRCPKRSEKGNIRAEARPIADQKGVFFRRLEEN